jgi:hypothetical protein
MGVITIEGSFEQAYYYEQDYIAQVTTLIVPCGPDVFDHDTRRAPAEKVTKAVAALDRPSIDKAPEAPGGSGGSAGPSIWALDPPEGADPIKVSFGLSP